MRILYRCYPVLFCTLTLLASCGGPTAPTETPPSASMSTQSESRFTSHSCPSDI